MVLLIAFCLTTKAQLVIPKFASNVSKKDSIENKIFLEQTEKFDFLVSIKVVGSWSVFINNYLIGLKKGKWKLVLLTTDIRDKNRKIINRKFRIEKRNISSKEGYSILQKLISNKLFDLNQDSLNIATDSKGITHTLNDGSRYEFSMKTKNSWKLIKAADPEGFLKLIPEIKQREYFISCTNIIYAAFAKSNLIRSYKKLMKKYKK